ncbi:expressed unknown protein [Seminavis robusta]|uniref:Uncharacterized protein n=1 Tax=Seminavis robusta TaxID=568900 RepID=A0A9N8HF54_9STRA|nr:expressed unknown protein [Seminavis robusta]|eukprot:Sro418_g138850.1 n/a (144) ;mRNA; r:20109-20540
MGRPLMSAADVAPFRRTLMGRIVGKVIRVKVDTPDETDKSSISNGRKGGVLRRSSLFLSSITMADFKNPALFHKEEEEEDEETTHHCSASTFGESGSLRFELLELQQSDSLPSVPKRRNSRAGVVDTKPKVPMRNKSVNRVPW